MNLRLNVHLMRVLLTGLVIVFLLILLMVLLHSGALHNGAVALHAELALGPNGAYKNC